MNQAVKLLLIALKLCFVYSVIPVSYLCSDTLSLSLLCHRQPGAGMHQEMENRSVNSTEVSIYLPNPPSLLTTKVMTDQNSSFFSR